MSNETNESISYFRNFILILLCFSRRDNILWIWWTDELMIWWSDEQMNLWSDDLMNLWTYDLINLMNLMTIAPTLKPFCPSFPNPSCFDPTLFLKTYDRTSLWTVRSREEESVETFQISEIFQHLVPNGYVFFFKEEEGWGTLVSFCLYMNLKEKRWFINPLFSIVWV